MVVAGWGKKKVYYYINNKFSTGTTTVNLLEHLSAVYASDLHSCNV
jgi:hypothetical protein